MLFVEAQRAAHGARSKGKNASMFFTILNFQFTLAFVRRPRVPMLGWLNWRPAVEHLTIEELHREYAALPPVSECDRSRRVQILERLVEELKRENDMLRRRSKASEGGLHPAHTVSHGYSERPVPYPIAFAVKGSLFTHVDTLKDVVSTQCPGAQWLTSCDYPNGGDITATARVLFFRTNQRVSPTELEELKTFCASPNNFVAFLHNEMRESNKDMDFAERYVVEAISRFEHATACASFAFREAELYPMSEGLNASSLAKLVAFVSAQARPTATRAP